MLPGQTLYLDIYITSNGQMGTFKYVVKGLQSMLISVLAAHFTKKRLTQKLFNLTKDMLSTHIAVIGDYVASCITFSYPNRVPAGNKYHVPLSCSCYEILTRRLYFL